MVGRTMRAPAASGEGGASGGRGGGDVSKRARIWAAAMEGKARGEERHAPCCRA